MKCSDTCCADKHDNPELDCTDFAHPAWWRGNDAGVASLVQIINGILDEPFLAEARGGTFGYPPLNALRTRLIALAKKP